MLACALLFAPFFFPHQIQGYEHYLGGGLVGIFNTSNPHQGSAVMVAGSGGGSGTNQCGRGGHGGLRGLGNGDGENMNGFAANPAIADCNGQGGFPGRGGPGGGRSGFGRLGGDGGMLRGGTFGACVAPRTTPQSRTTRTHRTHLPLGRTLRVF